MASSVAVSCAGYYAYHEITAVLDNNLAVHGLGNMIMEKLRKCSRRAPNPTPTEGLKIEISPNPMAPLKTVVWQRRAAADSGNQADTTSVEDVPYVLLYMTVSTPTPFGH